jgi:hypothetical protein
MSFVTDFSINYDSRALDASGALAVSQKSILGNYVQDKDNLPLLLDRVSSGTATQTWSNGVVSMSVGVGEYAICQSFKKHLYLAGKSQSAEITFNNFGLEANIVKRVGMFSSSTVAPYTASFDGFFLESDGTNIKLEIWKGGVSIASVNRDDWTDPLDGTGESGLSIDMDNFTVSMFDFLYLGGTALRLSFNVGGQVIHAHTIQNSSINATTFINSPVQPVRWEIRSTTGTGSLGQICAAVSTGGAVGVVGFPRAVDTAASFINANSTANTYLIAALRANTPHAVSHEVFGSTLATTNDPYIVRFILNPTIAGTPVFNAVTNSGFDVAIGDTSGNPSATTVTGGTILNAAFFSSQVRQGQLEANSLFQLGFDIAGNADVIALCVQPVSSNLDVRGAINFKTL